MKKKTNIALIFGGVSSEHEVSINSAISIYKNLDKKKFNVIPIGIDKKGKWYAFNDENFFVKGSNLKETRINIKNKIPNFRKGNISLLVELIEEKSVDVVFPIIHGNTGEDGKLQGLLELLNVPYVGPNVVSSSLCMDKDFAKRILQSNGIEVTKWITVKKGEKIPSYEKVKDVLSSEKLFVKPANEGSSVGINKVVEEREYYEAIIEAFKHDKKILIEEEIIGREIECSVLGNCIEDIKASLPGEVVSENNFYSYDAKYISSEQSKIEIPAKLDMETINLVRNIAKKAFLTLGCEGLSRVDFFITKNRVIVNEINTLPGFTEISMYPKMWEVTGIEYKELLTELIKLAQKKHKK